MGAQAIEEIAGVEVEPVGVAMGLRALRDFPGVEIDSVEFGDAIQILREPLEDASVARTDLDEPDGALAEIGKQPGDGLGDDGVVAQEEILETVRVPFIKLHRCG